MSARNVNASYEVLSPWPEVDPIPVKGISAPRVTDLAGKRVGLFCNSKRAAKLVLTAIEQRLREKFPTSEVSWYDPQMRYHFTQMEGENRQRFQKWVKEVDTVIAAVADWGSCTKYLVYEAVSVEEMNTPVVVMCNEGFTPDARAAAAGKGMPGVRIVPEPIPSECSDMEQAEKGVSAVMDNVIAALTGPLTVEEKSPRPNEAEKPTRIIFKGSLEDVNRFFYRRGWTDGLPIIPPTEEAVAEMLTGTDLPADHVVANVVPQLGKATVEKIAVNAVMAGALPTYMPVLIAALQAVVLPECDLGGWGVSTGSWSPFWIINGPIRNDLHINSGTGALSPGDIANAAIGRAMGFIIKNMGGTRKGVEDMGVLGNPMMYSLVIAENEEASPWEPLHVQHGFNKEDSTVAISAPNSFMQVMTYSTDDVGVLRAVVYNLVPGRRGAITLILPPQHAGFLASKGWTKQGIAAFIAEHARAQLYRFPQYYGNFPDRSRNMLLMNAEDSISIIDNPDSIRIIVAGGPGMFMGIIQGASQRGPLSKKIELPADWNKLVAKYKDVVPAYRQLLGKSPS